MNNIEILIDNFEQLKKNKFIIESIDPEFFFKFGENLIQENKELKEKFDVIQRKIYRLQEDNIELLKPRGKDQLNYKYIECPKVETEWYKSESYIKDNYIPKSKVKEKIEEYSKMINATYSDITSSGDYRRNVCFEIRKVLQELLEEGE